MDLSEFHKMVGETIMNCQTLENDVKIIYAAMSKGDFIKNYNSVKKDPFGSVLQQLKSLANSDGKPYITRFGYTVLEELKDIRNHWAHEAYLNFLYAKESVQEKAYQKEKERLENDCRKLEVFSTELEKIRLQILKEFGRL